ncbi:MAG: ABC-2 transporter permease [Cyclobacteriaceae bacterium]
MFLRIFSFELKYWLNNYLFYIYAGALFLIALLSMGSSAGLFESVTSTRSSITHLNSAYALTNFINGFSIIAFFLMPSIVGGTINKDYSSNTSNVLYSYPFSKTDYLLGKYLSSLVISILVMLSIALGAMAGGYFPGTNPELSGEFSLLNYMQPYLIFIIPNFIFFSAIVFGVVTFSRNIAAGFVAIIALFLVQGIAETIINNMDNKELGAWLDPFGSGAFRYYTEYWSVAEQNENPLPFEGLILYNRLLWGGLGVLIFSVVFYLFKFTHNPFSFQLRKPKGERVVKNNFGSMVRINLPEVSFDFSFVRRLKTAWQLSNYDFLFVVKSWPFIIIALIGLSMLTVTLLVGQQIFGTTTYPVTWQMLQIAGNVFTAIALLPISYLYMGMLVHRSRISKINQLVDATPVPNWTFLLSKFIAIVKVQMALLLLIMIAGMLIQTYDGFYEYEIGLYLTELYGIKLWHVLIYALFAIFIQTLSPNYLVGFFVTLGIAIGVSFLGEIGIEQTFYKFNQAPNPFYSPMNGYGSTLFPYYVYKLYWLLLGAAMYVFAIAFWRRGMPTTFKGKWQQGLLGLRGSLVTVMSVFLIGFLSIGGWIYHTENIKHEYVPSKQREERSVEQERRFGPYESMSQPRIVDVNVNVDLVPESRDFRVDGQFLLVNKTSDVIDSLLLNHNGYPSEFSFGQQVELVLEDTLYHYDFYVLDDPLQPGDSLEFSFQLWNKPNELLRSNSPIRNNGTFINNGLFPSFGYSSNAEIKDNAIREKYELPEKERMNSVYDTTAYGNTYISSSADWINFETVVSTSPEQIAIAPGYLQREWEENGRRYFHYKMDSKMINFYAYLSADYQIRQDKWNDVNIEIYYHKGHEYNLDRMVNSIKKSLDYYTENFSPYQHRQVRVIEFPRSSGMFAQSFANTIPYSEAVGFIAKVDDEDKDGLDYPFAVTAHEVAHQWWAHQVIGANVQGATLMSESMSEYSSLKVLEKEYGQQKMRVFLKDALDKYLQGRAQERLKEKPLMFNENQAYIHYNKGSLILYAISDYLGEEEFNNVMKAYIDSVGFQDAPYTTSLEYFSFLDAVTPDSLKYVLEDMLETITLYNNKVEETSYEQKEDQYEVTIDLLTSKYRADEEGNYIYKNEAGDSLALEIEGRRRPLQSLPLNDWIEVGIFGEKEVDGEMEEVPLYLEKHKFSRIDTTLRIIVNKEPVEVGIDPYHKLIDTNTNDNRLPVKEQEAKESED